MNADLRTWIKKQEPWMQDAAEKILRNGNVSEADIEHFVSIIKSPKKTEVAEGNDGSELAPAVGGSVVRLTSLGPARGVDALHPRRPIELADHDLSVIYGPNGSGKSGYTRIIKRACGKPNACELKPNVFSDEDTVPACEFHYEIDGIQKNVPWKSTDPTIDELECIDVFDTQCGRLYVDGETEMSFSPPELTFLSDLIDVCGRVESVLYKQQQMLVCRLPEMPPSFVGTNAGRFYCDIPADTNVKEVCANLTWSKEEEGEYKLLNQQLQDTDVSKRLGVAQKQLDQLNAIESELKAGAAAVSVSAIEQFDQQIRLCGEKRRAADEFAKSLALGTPIAGIEEASWRAMWKAAEAFAMEIGGDSAPFPRTDEGSRCVLCHQFLDEDARHRFQRFDEFIRGKLEAEAQAEASLLQAMIDGLPPEPTDASLSASAQASGEDEALEEELKATWELIRSRLAKLRQSVTPADPKSCQQRTESLVSTIGEIKRKREQAIAQLRKDSETFDREIGLERIRQLKARQWVVQQEKAIEAEVDRKKSILDFEKYRKSTTTTGISRQASKRSKTLITDAYIKRFNDELRKLGAQKFKVAIEKRTTKGRVLHKIVLSGVKRKISSPSDVLSEGEQRMVALAAFLADSTGRIASSPFVFDDPISSLDHAFEEKTVDRLIELSKSRQVIVFTHRLSLFGLISDKSNGKFNDVHIQREPWGTGEPGQMQLFPKKPLNAVKNLKNERLPQAQKVLLNDGYAAYSPLAKAICSDFRILMECIVETHLLSGVVQRHRRAVKTMGKLGKLVLITDDDCQIVEDMMTKYSCYEHSQSDELPGEPPEPDDLTKDMTKVIEWLTDFNKRVG